MNQFRYQSSAPTEPIRSFHNGTGLAVLWGLLLFGVMLPTLAIAGAQNTQTDLQRRKTELEVQKLAFEVAELREKRAESPGWVTGLGGFLVGGTSVWVALWKTRREQLGALDQSVHDKRLELYPQLVKATAPLAIYFSDHEPPGSIKPEDCREMGQALSRWYFGGGGLLLSDGSRNAYFDLARAFTRASQTRDLTVPSAPEDAEHLSIKKLGDYQKELGLHQSINVEAWGFGLEESEKEGLAGRFRDYVFLRRLSSILRSKLSEDLRGRLLAH